MSIDPDVMASTRRSPIRYYTPRGASSRGQSEELDQSGLPDVVPRQSKSRVKRRLKSSRSSNDLNNDGADDDNASVTSVDSLGSDHSRRRKTHRKVKRPPCPIHRPDTTQILTDVTTETPKCNCKKKRRKSATRRPEPEGAHLIIHPAEYDRILYENKPLFSDTEYDDPGENELIKQQSDRLHRYKSRRYITALNNI